MNIGNTLKNFKYFIKSLFYYKDKSIVLCSAWFGEKFSDNPRNLFQYLSANKDKLGLSHVVWVTYNEELCNELTDMGYEAYIMNSKESLYYHKHAYYHMCNNSPNRVGQFRGEFLEGLSYRSKRINLWHGTGIFKHFNMANNEYMRKIRNHRCIYAIKNYIYTHSKIFRMFAIGTGGWEDCYFLTTSESEMKKFRVCYPLPVKNFIISGYPRTSYESKMLKNEKAIVDSLKNYAKVILYLPTFRSNQSSFDINVLSGALESVLVEKNFLLIQKTHSAYQGSSIESRNKNILNLGMDFDVNVITQYVDLVITDYSSIIADALYYNKPIILYTPDYDEYVNDDRGLFEDSKFIFSATSRFDEIEDLVKFIETYAEDYTVIKPSIYDNVKRAIWGNKTISINEIWEAITERVK